jgi:hypothetical protein
MKGILQRKEKYEILRGVKRSEKLNASKAKLTFAV